MPDLRELRVFVAVAEAGSFTRAAEQLYVTQQAVSKTVRDLEHELGVELLERTSREVRPTAAGRALMEPGRAVLTQADAAFAAAREVGTGRAGRITVGVTPAVGPETRADVVRALRTHPDRSVTIRDLRPGELRDGLRARSVDLALACVTGTLDTALDRAELRPSRMQVHVPVTHPLGASREARLENFDRARLLTASPAGTPYTDLLVARFAAAGATVTPVEARVTGGQQVLTELVEVGAVAAMPVGTQSPGGVHALSIPGFTVPLVVLWPAGRPSHAVGLLREQLAG